MLTITSAQYIPAKRESISRILDAHGNQIGVLSVTDAEINGNSFYKARIRIFTSFGSVTAEYDMVKGSAEDSINFLLGKVESTAKTVFMFFRA